MMRKNVPTKNHMLLVCTIITILLIFPSVVYTYDQGLKITIISSGQLLLEWDDIKGAREYLVERKVNSGKFEGRAVLRATENDFLDSGLIKSHSYTYRITALDNSGNVTGRSGEITVNTGMVKTPAGLVLTPLGPDSVKLEWHYDDNEKYETVVERRKAGSSDWQTVAYVPAGKTGYTDTGLVADTLYYYRIAAVSGTNIYSVYYPRSGGNSVRTLMEPPGNLTGYVTGNLNIHLSWTDVKGETGYIIERSEGDGNFAIVAITGENRSTWTDTDTVDGRIYTYRVKAENAVNESEYSNEITITCVYIAPPFRVNAAAREYTGIEVAWSDIASLEGEFELWRKESEGGEWELYTVLPRNVRSFADSLVLPGTRYYYRVRVYIPYKHAYSTFSKEISAVPVSYTAPGNLRWQLVSDRYIRLTWDDTLAGEDSFIVERRTFNEDWMLLATLPSGSAYYTDKSVKKGEVYFYRVARENKSLGVVTYSEVVKTETEIPESPSNLSVVPVTSGIVRLIWTDNSENEDGFIIQRRVGNTGFVTIDKVDGDTTCYIDYGLSPGIRYGYRVCAYNGAGESAFTAVRYAKTMELPSFTDLKAGAPGWQAATELVSAGIMEAEDNRFRPDSVITRGEFVSSLARMLELDENKTVGSFTDVIYGYKFYSDIMRAAWAGLASGDENNMFYPEKALTSEDMAVFVFRALRYKDAFSDNNNYTGIDEFDYAGTISSHVKACVMVLSNEGILDAKDILSKHQTEVTRKEAAEIIYKVFRKILDKTALPN